MQRFSLLALVCALTVLSVGTLTVLAQPPDIKKQDGHVSPLMAEVTYVNGTKRTEMILGTAYGAGQSRFVLVGVDPEGVKQSVWLDTIASIEDTDVKNKVVLRLKDGNRLRLISEWENLVYGLVIAKDTDSNAELPFGKVQSIRFLKTARKDGDGNAMFDHWKYSPYTGEKLSPP